MTSDDRVIAGPGHRAPERVIVVGGGAREHALAWRIGRDADVAEVHVVPGNPGMGDVATTHGEVDDLAGVVALARRLEADLVVVGPEAPLAAGLADLLIDADIPVFGPTRVAAGLESSKTFCREVAEIAGIPMAEGASFAQPDEAIAYARALAAPVAVKADGLAGGKGVVLCDTLADSERAIRAALEGDAFGEAGRSVIVERRLAGPEVSVMAICDGERAVALPAARDHKRVADGDRGPNTGGMGAFSPVAELDDAAVERLLAEFHRPALAELARRGIPFRGVLYAGLMLTDEGPRLLEFNVRFGDPEAQAVLPRLEGAFASTLLAAAMGGLGDVATPTAGAEAAVAVVIASPGYPEASSGAGAPIEGVRDARSAGALVFHGATGSRDGRLVTGRGRVLTVVGRDADIVHARERAYDGVARIRFPGMQFRKDIGAVREPVLVAAGERGESTDRPVASRDWPQPEAPLRPELMEQPEPSKQPELSLQPEPSIQAEPSMQPEPPTRSELSSDRRDDGSSVAIVVGSANDLKRLDEARAVFDWFGIVYEVHVASAHRAPRRVLALGEGAAGRGIKVLIAGAGKAAALPGVLAAATTLPVIGVPFSSPDLGGMDALLSAVQMPRGVPVATVAIDGVANAAILAAEICAISDARLARRLGEFKAALADGADVMRLVQGEGRDEVGGGSPQRGAAASGSPAQRVETSR